MTRVTAVVATFNAVRYLGEAIASIRTQTRPPEEIIIVDDGSTDGTEALVETLGADIRYLRTSDIGPSATRNHGVAAATGDYVAFLDADDLWAPHKLEMQLAALAAGAARCCLGQVQLVWEAPDSPTAAYFKTHPRGQAIPGFATIALLAERALFEEVGFFDPTLWQADTVEWFERAEALGHRPVILDEVVVYHRVHGSNLTERRRQAGIEEFAAVLRRRIRSGRARAG